MKNILVPIGDRENASNTLQYAIDFAEQINAKIYVVNVYNSIKVSGSFQKFDQLLEKESLAILKEQLNQVNTKNVSVTSHALKGHDVLSSLKLLIKHLEINLIITSTKNDNSDDTVFLGSITGALIKDTDTPVLIIPSKATFKKIDKVLMTIKSGLIKSESTLDPILKIKKAFNPTINLLQVRTPKLQEGDLSINPLLNDLTQTVLHTKNATVFQGVLEFLRVENPDLLCVIRRKRGFFKKLWEQNKVKKVDFESNIPLLVLKGDS